MKTESHRPAVIEGLEQRVLLDASQLSETIVSSTLPASASDQAALKGTVSVQVSNNSADTQAFKGTIGVDAAVQTLDIPAHSFVTLKSMPTAISLTAGQTKVFKVAINLAAGKLADGSYNVFGVVTDQGGVSSQSPAGPTLLVRPPDVSLTETETFKNLPASTKLNATLKAIDSIKITNNGSDPFTGVLNIALLAAPNDIVAGRNPRRIGGKEIHDRPEAQRFAHPQLTSEAGLTGGTYRMLSAATQPNGTVTSSNPATAPSFTVIAPATKPDFVDTISSATPVYATDSSDASAQHITQLDLMMSIVNNGCRVHRLRSVHPVRLHQTNLRFHRHQGEFPAAAVDAGRIPRLKQPLPNRFRHSRHRPRQWNPHQLLRLRPSHRHLWRCEHGQLRHADFLRGADRLIMNW